MTLRLIAKNAAWSLLAHVLNSGSLVLASIILARQFNTTDFATYSYFQMTVSMLAAYSALGLGVAASRYFAEIGSVRVIRDPPLGAAWTLSIFAGLCGALIVMILPASWIEAGLEIPRWLLSLGVFVIAIGIVPSGGVLGLERYREATVSASASALIIVVGALIAAASNSAILAMWAYLLAALTQAAGNAYVAVRGAGGLRCLYLSTRFGKVELTEIIDFAGPMTVVSLFAASGTWIVGRMLLRETAGEHEFRLYAIGLQWFALALMLPGMVSRVILPRLIRSRIESGEDHDSRGKNITRIGGGASLGAALAVTIAAASLSPLLWRMYAIDDDRGARLIVIFLCAAIPAAPANAIGNAIVANGGQWAWLGISVAGFVCLIWTAMQLSPFGAFGGAIALASGSMLVSLLAASVAYWRGLI